MGVVVVGTLLAARLAGRTCRTADRQMLLRRVSAAGIALGLLFYGVDLHDALADKEAAERAAATVRAGPGRPHLVRRALGISTLCRARAGMKPVIPEQSHLQEGDWLVVPDRGIIQQQILVDTYCTELAARFPRGKFPARANGARILRRPRALGTPPWPAGRSGNLSGHPALCATRGRGLEWEGIASGGSPR